jgi:hypothetical protein
MAMGRRQHRERQEDLWIAHAELAAAPGHPFYERLNAVLDAEGFDRFVEGLCARFYAPQFGRPSLTPGIYFRSLLIGYFEGVGAERGIAWRMADSLALRRCHLRGRKNILKRQLAHVSAFNPSLIMRQLLGAGTPRELKNRAVQLVLRLFLLLACQNLPNSAVEPRTDFILGSSRIHREIRTRCRTVWNSATCTTG